MVRVCFLAIAGWAKHDVPTKTKQVSKRTRLKLANKISNSDSKCIYTWTGEPWEEQGNSDYYVSIYKRKGNRAKQNNDDNKASNKDSYNVAVNKQNLDTMADKLNRENKSAGKQ